MDHGGKNAAGVSNNSKTSLPTCPFCCFGGNIIFHEKGKGSRTGAHKGGTAPLSAGFKLPQAEG
jgi:hypothetical protein